MTTSLLFYYRNEMLSIAKESALATISNVIISYRVVRLHGRSQKKSSIVSIEQAVFSAFLVLVTVVGLVTVVTGIDLSKILGEPKYWGQRVATTDETNSVFFNYWEAHVRAPPKSTPMAPITSFISTPQPEPSNERMASNPFAGYGNRSRFLCSLSQRVIHCSTAQ